MTAATMPLAGESEGVRMSDFDRQQCHHQAVGWLLHSAESHLPGLLAATAERAQTVADNSGRPDDQAVADCLRGWSERHSPVHLTYRWKLTTDAVRRFLVEKNIPSDELAQWADALSVLVREELVGPEGTPGASQEGSC